MRILEARVEDRSYCADFGRVEAVVVLFVKDRVGQPPHEIRMSTSQPLHGILPLEDRLIADAIRLAQSINCRSSAQTDENMPLAA